MRFREGEMGGTAVATARAKGEGDSQGQSRDGGREYKRSGLRSHVNTTQRQWTRRVEALALHPGMHPGNGTPCPLALWVARLVCPSPQQSVVVVLVAKSGELLYALRRAEKGQGRCPQKAVTPAVPPRTSGINHELQVVKNLWVVPKSDFEKSKCAMVSHRWMQPDEIAGGQSVHHRVQLACLPYVAEATGMALELLIVVPKIVISATQNFERITRHPLEFKVGIEPCDIVVFVDNVEGEDFISPEVATVNIVQRPKPILIPLHWATAARKLIDGNVFPYERVNISLAAQGRFPNF